MHRRHPQNSGWFTAAHAHRACSPGNVGSGYPVCVVLEATRCATEEGLAPAVLPGGVTASWALLAGVPRVYRHHPHPLEGRLVLQQRAEAGVGPEVMQVPLSAAAFGGATPETSQAFNRQCVAGLQTIHDAPRQGVQDVVDETSFPSRKPFPKSLHASGAFGRAVQPALDLSPLPQIVQTLALDGSTRKLHPTGEGGQGLLPQVHPYHLASTAGRLWGFHPQGKVDVPLALRPLGEHPALDALGPRQHPPLVVAELHGDYQAAHGGGERDRLPSQGKGALVKGAGDGSVVLRPATLLAPHAGDGLHGEVGAEAHRSEVAVDQAVQLESAKLPLLLGYPECVVATLGKQPYRLFQSRRLFRGGLQGTAEGKRLHKGIIAHHAKGEAALLPMPEGRGLRAAVVR